MEDNKDYIGNLEEIMNNAAIDDEDFIAALSEAQKNIMDNADKILAEMAGVADVSEFMELPKAEQSRRMEEMNNKFLEMIHMTPEEAAELDRQARDKERREIIENIQIPEELSEELGKMYRNAIYIEAAESAEVYPGCSKIGGFPDVPADFQWMRSNEGNALTFLMQINCEEIHPLDKDNIFPEKGMLYFFYDFDSEPWDSEENGYAVCYYDGDIPELQPCPFPDDRGSGYFKYAEENCVINEQPVKFFSAPDLPEYDDNEDAAEKYSYEEYEAARYKLLGYDPDDYSEEYFKLSGYSNSIQYGLSEEFDSSYVQLCQLSTFECDGCGFMFGDGGSLYFYIKKEDLSSRQFDKAEISLQCY